MPRHLYYYNIEVGLGTRTERNIYMWTGGYGVIGTMCQCNDIGSGVCIYLIAWFQWGVIGKLEGYGRERNASFFFFFLFRCFTSHPSLISTRHLRL